jgi:hypothetical protein
MSLIINYKSMCLFPYNMSELIWQPKNLHCWPNYDIEVSRSFMEQASNLHITNEFSNSLNAYAKSILEKNFKCSASNPFEFFEDTYVVSQFNIDGGGRWFASKIPAYGKNILDVFQDNQNIIYSGHNIDTSTHSIAMLRLMDVWTSYFSIIKESHQKK